VVDGVGSGEQAMAKHGRIRAVSRGAFLVALAWVAAAQPAESAPVTSRVDVRSDGGLPEFGGVVSNLSADGRLVAFSSSANDLTPDDTHEGAMGRDVFVRDRGAATTTRISVASNGAQGNGESDEPSISAGGRLVAFSSYASNFAAGDLNENADVFVRDRRSATTTIVSVASNGARASSWSGQPSISASGRFVAFTSLATNLARVRGLRERVFVHDRRTRRTRLVTPVRWNASRPSISANGRFVAFTRARPRTSSVHVVDRRTGRIRRVDLSSRERPADRASHSASISGSGRFVAFASRARNLIPHDGNRGPDIFVRDRRRGTTRRISIRPNGSPLRRCPRTSNPDVEPPPLCAGDPKISANGRYVTFITHVRRFDHTGPPGGVFLRDRRTRQTTRISITSNGQPVSADLPSISPDGRFVAFRQDGILIRGPLR
jgi:Tol biopolymer transport system component